MAEAALITITDINTIRKIDPKFNADRLENFINSVQRKNLRDLLGDALYYDFMADDRTSGKYKDILEGKSYTYGSDTIQYYGLKPMLSFWVLAVIARESEMYLSGYGAIQFNDNPQQQFQVAKEKERTATMYMEDATRYANDVVKFLNQHTSTYTLWNGDSETNPSEFFTFKV